ncbi:MAG: queuosine salvage family protein [Acidimicrobiia bacterium]|nr:queuosine salvage family protein [Acidimicrobiia bacterium]
MAISAWDGPILRSVRPVITQSRSVRTNIDSIATVAGWMAFEEFTFPSGASAGPFALGSTPDEIVDFVMLASALNFAFTDFKSGVKYSVEYDGTIWSDTEGMFVRIHQAVAAGTDLCDGSLMAKITSSNLADVFAGNIVMPMLDARAEILNSIGSVLEDRYEGRFHNFVASCPPAMYDNGDGLLERLIEEFPRFNDSSPYRGETVQLHKLGQLALWSLHMGLHGSGDWALRDLTDMTAFADYIVPVALRLMGILEYSPDLEQRINSGTMIARDSPEEVEIRAHTVYATALLTDAINELRSSDRQLVIPQVDYRLWKSYHATTWPHHLTETVMY